MKRKDVTKLYDGDAPNVVRFTPPFRGSVEMLPKMEGGMRRMADGRISIKDTPYNLNIMKKYLPDVPLIFSRPESHKEISLGGNHPRIYIEKNKSYQHQKKIFETAKDKEYFAIFGEPGTGKTKSGIDIAGYHYVRDEITGLLIITFNGVHRQWISKEIPRHLGYTNDDEIGDLQVPVPHITDYWDGQSYRQEFVRAEVDEYGFEILAITFETPNTKFGVKPTHDFIERHRGKLMCIVDESHAIMNYDSLRSRACRAIGRKSLIRLIMTGTPIANKLENEWAQSMFLSDKIFSFGQPTSFRNNFTRLNRITGKTEDCNIVEFRKIMEPHCFRITKAECLDLPKKLYDTFEFDLGIEQRRYYDELKRNFLTKIKTPDGVKIVTVPNAGVLRIRLQQISSGLLVDESIDGKTPGAVYNIPSERPNALDNLMNKFERGYKVLVWCRFKHNIEESYRVLAKHGNVAAMDGSTPKADRAEIIRQFIEGDIDFLTANPQVAGTGLDFTGDNFHIKEVVYYTNGDQSIQRWQSEDRVHRIGMNNQVRYTDIIAKRTIDTGIMIRLKQNKDLADLALGDLERLIDDEHDPEVVKYNEALNDSADPFWDTWSK